MRKSGIELITEERKEQIEKHGWDLSDDKSYSEEELLKAALFCIDQKRFEWPFYWMGIFRAKILKSIENELKQKNLVCFDVAIRLVLVFCQFLLQ